jgi:hypothetical protein
VLSRYFLEELTTKQHVSEIIDELNLPASTIPEMMEQIRKRLTEHIEAAEQRGRDSVDIRCEYCDG